MNALLVSIMAKISESQARIAAMEAANTHRLSVDSSISYDYAEFVYEANILERLAAEAAAIHQSDEATRLPNCGCRIGECDSKTDAPCRMAGEISTRDDQK